MVHLKNGFIIPPCGLNHFALIKKWREDGRLLTNSLPTSNFLIKLSVSTGKCNGVNALSQFCMNLLVSKSHLIFYIYFSGKWSFYIPPCGRSHFALIKKWQEDGRLLTNSLPTSNFLIKLNVGTGYCNGVNALSLNLLITKHH